LSFFPLYPRVEYIYTPKKKVFSTQLKAFLHLLKINTLFVPTFPQNGRLYKPKIGHTTFFPQSSPQCPTVLGNTRFLSQSFPKISLKGKLNYPKALIGPKGVLDLLGTGLLLPSINLVFVSGIKLV